MQKKLYLILYTLLIQSSSIFSHEEKKPELMFENSEKIQEFVKKHHRGSLKVVTGAMCSGKSGYLIEQEKRWKRAKKNVATFKPVIDNRKLFLKEDVDPTQVLSSRTETSTRCFPVSSVDDLRKKIEQENPTHIIIDEVHFFTPEKEAFVDFILKLVKQGKHVIASGLDLSFRNEAFGPMPELLTHADSVKKLTANCAVCHEDTYCISQRLVNGKPAHYNDPLIVVGAEELYEPRCRECHECPKE